MEKRKCCCVLCKNEVSVNQLNVHYNSKQCNNGKSYNGKRLPIPEDWICPHCKEDQKSRNPYRTHTRNCPLNPDSTWVSGFKGHLSKTKGKTKYNNETCRKASETIKRRYANGELIRSHTEETKQRLSILACERLAKHSKYSKNVEYKPGVILESSFEIRTAEILDELGIEWIKVRRGYEWNDNGKKRRYIPDFYLPKYDIFLDPKNDFLIKKDKAKIDSAMQINGIKVIVLSDKEICKEFIENICSSALVGGGVL